MFFLRREAHTHPLLKDFNIRKYHDKIALKNYVFIHKSFKHPKPFPKILKPKTQGGHI